ncbi:MAG: hypothetical protein RL516_411 [Bacteroidota bacterium]|jgi:DNA uptake protein ComE-like DNA-binding protein
MRKAFIFVGLIISCEVHAQNNGSDFGITISDDELVNANFQDQLFVDSAEHLKINFANKEQLLQSGLFVGMEIDSIISYRSKYGYFFSVEEMQVLDMISLGRLEKLKDILSFEIPTSLNELVDLKKINGKVVARIAAPFSKGNVEEEWIYKGNKYREAIGLKINLSDRIDFVLNAEKDAGEAFQFTKKVKGFDFFSTHLTVKNIRRINKITIGDYQIQLGQGLAIWQGMSLGKTSDIATIRKQEIGIKDYNGMSEFGFFRGMAIDYKIKKVKIVHWVSYKNQDATIYSDSLNGNYIQSIKTDGYHRTDLELEHKNSIQQTVVGSSYSMLFRNTTIGLNSVFTSNSIAIKPNNDYYNYYAFRGKNSFNQSISYSGTRSNFNYFGEASIDQNLSPAIVNGIIASIEKNFSMSLLHRYYSKNYFSFHTNAFGENSKVANENGFYIGGSYSYNKKIQLSGYYDFYKFPWLKYQISMPSYGQDYSIQFIYTPTKTSSISLRYHQTRNQEEVLSNDIRTSDINESTTRSLRFQFRTEINRIQITSRYDLTFLKQQTNESGMLAYLDVQYKPMLKPYSFSMRASVYRTESYSTRMYAYQSDLPGSYNLGAFYGSGEVVYVMVHYKPARNMHLWVRGSRMLSYSQLVDNDNFCPEYEVKMQAAYQF